MSSTTFRILLGNMSLRCPPELLLRQAIRRDFQNGTLSPTARSLCTRETSSENNTYRAALCTEIGKPLTIQQLSRKPLTDGQVRLRIHSVGVNFGDILMVQGQYQEKPQLPFTPGSEVAGEVVEIGPGVKHVETGQRVFGMSHSFGGYSEEMILDSFSLVPIPQNVDYPSAAALLCSYGTAYLALKHRCQIKPGEVVLVTAAAGGVGLAAVDLATNMFGAKVIGACGGSQKCALVKQRGAIEAIDYNSENVKDRVKELTNGKGANVIIDAVGGDIFDQCVRCVAFEGRLAVIGFASGKIPKIPANLLLVKSCSAVGVYWGSYSHRYPEMFQESVAEVTKAIASGQIRPHVSKTFPLEQVNEAFMFVAKRKSTGKVVVTM